MAGCCCRRKGKHSTVFPRSLQLWFWFSSCGNASEISIEGVFDCSSIDLALLSGIGDLTALKGRSVAASSVVAWVGRHRSLPRESKRFRLLGSCAWCLGGHFGTCRVFQELVIRCQTSEPPHCILSSPALSHCMLFTTTDGQAKAVSTMSSTVIVLELQSKRFQGNRVLESFDLGSSRALKRLEVSLQCSLGNDCNPVTLLSVR